MGGGGSSLDKLLKAWGIQFDTSKVVADLQFKMQLRGRNGQPQEAPAWLALTADGINKDDVATSQIDNIWLPLCGAFTGTPVAGLKETVLLHSSKDSQLVDAMLANLSGENIMKEFKPSGVNYTLAIRLTGKFKTAFPDGEPQDKKDEKTDKKRDKKPDEKKADDSLKETKGDNTVVLFGDADMLYDPFTMRRIDSPFGAMQMAMNANLNLAQNLVEQMTGDSNLIAVRSRATLTRPFTRVKEMEAAANEKFQSEIKRLEDSAAEAQRKINELQAQKKDKDQRFILSPEQRAELEKLRKEEAETAQAPEAGAEGLAQRGRLAADADQVDQHSGRAAGGDGDGHCHRHWLTAERLRQNESETTSSFSWCWSWRLGVAGWWLYQRNQDSWQGGTPGPPAKSSWATCPSMTSPPIVIKGGTNELDLVKKDNLWRVKQRDDYPANFSEISGFLLKAADLKAVQTEEVGASQLGRYKLLPPGPATNTAVLVELRDQNGKADQVLAAGQDAHAQDRRPPFADGRDGRQRRLARWPLRHGRHRRQDRRRGFRSR